MDHSSSWRLWPEWYPEYSSWPREEATQIVNTSSPERRDAWQGNKNSFYLIPSQWVRHWVCQSGLHSKRRLMLRLLRPWWHSAGVLVRMKPAERFLCWGENCWLLLRLFWHSWSFTVILHTNRGNTEHLNTLDKLLVGLWHEVNQLKTP